MFSIFVGLINSLCPSQSLAVSCFDVHSWPLLFIILQASQMKTVEGFSAKTFFSYSPVFQISESLYYPFRVLIFSGIFSLLYIFRVGQTCDMSTVILMLLSVHWLIFLLAFVYLSMIFVLYYPFFRGFVFFNLLVYENLDEPVNLEF